MQFSYKSRAMAFRVTDRSSTWLQNWEVDLAIENQVTGILFKGSNLSGDGMDKCLIEERDKKRALYL